MRLIGLSEAETVRLIEADRAEITQVERRTSDPKNEVKTDMAAPRRKLMRFIKIALAISFLGTIFVLVRVHYMQTDNDHEGVFHFSSIFVPRVYKIEDVVKLKLEDNSLAFTDSATGQFISLKFAGGEGINKAPDLDSCLKILGTEDARHARKLKLGYDPFAKTVCLKWKNTVLVVNDTQSKRSRCFSVKWTTEKSSSPVNCLSMSGAHWYGGSLLREQHWPLEKVSIPMQPFISSPLSLFQNQDTAHSHGDYGPVLERMWLNSAGFGIMADSQEPLHVSVNAHQKARLCLKTQRYDDVGADNHGAEGGDGGDNTQDNFKEKDSGRPLTLTYHVCMDRPARYVHEHLLTSFLRLPKEAPSQRLMQRPLWSTQGINVHGLTQWEAVGLKNNISTHALPASQIHIAGSLSSTVGKLVLDSRRFPKSFQMLGEITFNGFPVSTRLLPFIEREVADYKKGEQLGAFVAAADSAKDLYPGWQNKSLYLVDFTNSEVCEWMTARLKSFMAESSVTSFHFEHGEASLLPKTQSPPFSLQNPSDYSRHFVSFARTLGNDSVVSVGHRTQEFGLFVDIGPRRSSWDYDQGLKTIIPSVLTLGLLGYPFLVVGPVGGVVVTEGEGEGLNNRFAVPEEELYIRWLQLSVFLPAFELSVGPWEYSAQAMNVTRALLKYRTDKILPILQTGAKEFLHHGAPIIRPLWWMAPDDEYAQSVDCEFLLTNKMLVAPVLQPGARRRDVYLPKVKDMRWKDATQRGEASEGSKGKVYTGGQWLRGFPVDITEVAVFVPVLRSQAEYHLVHD